MRGGSVKSMDSPDRLEIYIPVEAEVKCIPLWSLPASVLRRMGLSACDPEGSKTLASSPEGIWISPAVIRRKGEKLAPHTGRTTKENLSLRLSRVFQAAPGPLRMSFVSSNSAAYDVLRDIKPSATRRSHASALPQGSPPQTYRTAIVVYKGCIYLSIRKSSQIHPETSGPSTPSSSSKRQKKVLLKDNRHKKKHAKGGAREASSSRAARSAPLSSDGAPEADGPRHRGGPQQQAAEDAAAPGPAWAQEVGPGEDGGERETQCLDSSETEVTSPRGATVPPGAACASTSLVKECDFDELENEERITQMKARLKLTEAALDCLPSSQ